MEDTHYIILHLLTILTLSSIIICSKCKQKKPEIKFHNGLVTHLPDPNFHIISIYSTDSNTLRIHYEYKLQASSIEISYEEAENSGIFNPDKFYEYINK